MNALLKAWLALLLWFGAPIAFASNHSEITIGILATRSKAQTYQRWQPLEALLNKNTDHKTFKVKALYHRELESAVANREVGYVLCNPALYIYLQELYGLSSPMMTMINRDSDRNLEAFGGVVFTRSDNVSINTLPDLEGKTVSIASRHSFGGYQMQAYELESQQAGLTQAIRFRELGMSNDDLVESVLSGDSDAGFVRTGTLEAMVNEGKTSLDKINIINQQQLPGYPFVTSTTLYPEWPLASLPHIDREVTKHLIATLLKLSAKDTAAQAMQIGGFSIPANYTSVTSLMRDLRLPPFNRVSQISMHDIWEEYKQAIVLGVVLIIVMLLGHIQLLRLNRKLAFAHKEIDDDKRELADIIWATRVGTWSWSANTSGIDINRRWAEMLGYPLEDLTPLDYDTWISLIHPDDLPALLAAGDSHLSGQDPYYQHEFRMQHKDGCWIWILTRGNIVERDDTGKPLRVSGTHTDISEQKKLEADQEAYREQLEKLATTDSLTNVSNRRHFIDSSEALFAAARRGKHTMSFLMVDADHFKKVNDTYGHHAGDLVLKRIAELLKKSVRHGDLLARFGGEEFGILMPDTDPDQALQIARRITEAAKLEVVAVDNTQINFGLSIGVSSMVTGSETLNDLMIAADAALYEVKESGRGFAKLAVAAKAAV